MRDVQDRQDVRTRTSGWISGAGHHGSPSDKNAQQCRPRRVCLRPPGTSRPRRETTATGRFPDFRIVAPFAAFSGRNPMAWWRCATGYSCGSSAGLGGLRPPPGLPD